ncbi:MAG: hypothetical protein IT289_07590 [Oligoflexia bacterium]|nr:hypothetical protein [Oligoflexia bacterium]
MIARWVLESMARQLSRLDRREWSPTFGCFDRDYWKYKTLSEFPRLTFQQSTLALTLLYKNRFDGNIYYGNSEVKTWIEAAILFWVKNKNADGSVDEWFENERSFCATAHTAFAISEAVALMREELSTQTLQEIYESLETTALWLSKHQNFEVANQMAASLLAIERVYFLTKKDSLKSAYAIRKSEFLKMQNREGWFSEYGGADIGYSLLTLDLQALLSLNTNEPEYERAMIKLTEFLANFVRSDGVSGGNIGSRATCHYFPFGLKYLASQGNDLAKILFSKMNLASESGNLPNPAIVDDNYCSYFYLNSFCLSISRPGIAIANPLASTAKNEIKYFSESGLLVVRTNKYEMIFSASRGGSLSVVSISGEVYEDGGYFISTKDNRWITSQTSNRTPELQVNSNMPLIIDLKTDFQKVDRSLPMKSYGILFRIFAKWILAIPGLSIRFTRWLKHRKITKAKTVLSQSPCILHRHIECNPHSIKIEDTLNLRPGVVIEKVLRCKTDVALHSPSTGTFLVNDLTSQLLPLEEGLSRTNQFTYELEF